MGGILFHALWNLILKESTIFGSSIADVVDAITSSRPYREAKRMDEAVNILQKDEKKYYKEFITVLKRLLLNDNGTSPLG